MIQTFALPFFILSTFAMDYIPGFIAWLSDLDPICFVQNNIPMLANTIILGANHTAGTMMDATIDLSTGVMDTTTTIMAQTTTEMTTNSINMWSSLGGFWWTIFADPKLWINVGVGLATIFISVVTYITRDENNAGIMERWQIDTNFKIAGADVGTEPEWQLVTMPDSAEDQERRKTLTQIIQTDSRPIPRRRFPDRFDNVDGLRGVMNTQRFMNALNNNGVNNSGGLRFNGQGQLGSNNHTSGLGLGFNNNNAGGLNNYTGGLEVSPLSTRRIPRSALALENVGSPGSALPNFQQSPAGNGSTDQGSTSYQYRMTGMAVIETKSKPLREDDIVAKIQQDMAEGKIVLPENTVAPGKFIYRMSTLNGQAYNPNTLGGQNPIARSNSITPPCTPEAAALKAHFESMQKMGFNASVAVDARAGFVPPMETEMVDPMETVPMAASMDAAVPMDAALAVATCGGDSPVFTDPPVFTSVQRSSSVLNHANGVASVQSPSMFNNLTDTSRFTEEELDLRGNASLKESEVEHELYSDGQAEIYRSFDASVMDEIYHSVDASQSAQVDAPQSARVDGSQEIDAVSPIMIRPSMIPSASMLFGNSHPLAKEISYSYQSCDKEISHEESSDKTVFHEEVSHPIAKQKDESDYTKQKDESDHGGQETGLVEDKDEDGKLKKLCATPQHQDNIPTMTPGTAETESELGIANLEEIPKMGSIETEGLVENQLGAKGDYHAENQFGVNVEYKGQLGIMDEESDGLVDDLDHDDHQDVSEAVNQSLIGETDEENYPAKFSPVSDSGLAEFAKKATSSTEKFLAPVVKSPASKSLTSKQGFEFDQLDSSAPLIMNPSSNIAQPSLDDFLEPAQYTKEVASIDVQPNNVQVNQYNSQASASLPTASDAVSQPTASPPASQPDSMVNFSVGSPESISCAETLRRPLVAAPPIDAPAAVTTQEGDVPPSASSHPFNSAMNSSPLDTPPATAVFSSKAAPKRVAPTPRSIFAPKAAAPKAGVRKPARGDAATKSKDKSKGRPKVPDDDEGESPSSSFSSSSSSDSSDSPVNVKREIFKQADSSSADTSSSDSSSANSEKSDSPRGELVKSDAPADAAKADSQKCPSETSDSAAEIAKLGRSLTEAAAKKAANMAAKSSHPMPSSKLSQPMPDTVPKASPAKLMQIVQNVASPQRKDKMLKDREENLSANQSSVDELAGVVEREMEAKRRADKRKENTEKLKSLFKMPTGKVPIGNKNVRKELGKDMVKKELVKVTKNVVEEKGILIPKQEQNAREALVPSKEDDTLTSPQEKESLLPRRKQETLHVALEIARGVEMDSEAAHVVEADENYIANAVEANDDDNNDSAQAVRRFNYDDAFIIGGNKDDDASNIGGSKEQDASNIGGGKEEDASNKSDDSSEVQIVEVPIVISDSDVENVDADDADSSCVEIISGENSVSNIGPNDSISNVGPNNMKNHSNNEKMDLQSEVFTEEESIDSQRWDDYCLHTQYVCGKMPDCVPLDRRAGSGMNAGGARSRVAGMKSRLEEQGDVDGQYRSLMQLIHPASVQHLSCAIPWEAALAGVAGELCLLLGVEYWESHIRRKARFWMQFCSPIFSGFECVMLYNVIRILRLGKTAEVFSAMALTDDIAVKYPLKLGAKKNKLVPVNPKHLFSLPAEETRNVPELRFIEIIFAFMGFIRKSFTPYLDDIDSRDETAGFIQWQNVDSIRSALFDNYLVRAPERATFRAIWYELNSAKKQAAAVEDFIQLLVSNGSFVKMSLRNYPEAEEELESITSDPHMQLNGCPTHIYRYVECSAKNIISTGLSVGQGQRGLVPQGSSVDQGRHGLSVAQSSRDAPFGHNGSRDTPFVSKDAGRNDTPPLTARNSRGEGTYHRGPFEFISLEVRKTRKRASPWLDENSVVLKRRLLGKWADLDSRIVCQIVQEGEGKLVVHVDITAAMKTAAKSTSMKSDKPLATTQKYTAVLETTKGEMLQAILGRKSGASDAAGVLTVTTTNVTSNGEDGLLVSFSSPEFKTMLKKLQTEVAMTKEFPMKVEPMKKR